MTLYGASLIFAVLFLGVIYVLVAPKVWRGESGLDGDRPPDWWFLGNTLWRGVARAYLASAPFIIVMFAGGIVAEFSDSYDAGMTIGLLGLLAGAVLHASIVLFNQPKALVPPHLRAEPGALAARRQRRIREARRRPVG
jgi:ammonia channel protein AmtB